jgi:hypothetical protein
MPDDPMSEGGGAGAPAEEKTTAEAPPETAAPAAAPPPKPAPAVAAAPRPAAAPGAPKPAPAVARPAPAVAAKPAPAAGAKPAAAAAPRPAAPAKPATPSPTPEQIAAERTKIVSVLEEKRRLGEPVTITVEHKEVVLTGRVLRIEPEEGFVVLENVDGRRRGLWFILGGSLKTRDGQEIKLPVDGVPR